MFFETDAQAFTTAFESHITEFGDLMWGWVAIMARNPNSVVCLVRRERNKVAHALAKHSISFHEPFTGSDSPEWLDDMGVIVAYHFNGQFILDGADVRYSGGEVVRVEDVEPDTINVYYLDVALKNEVRYSGICKYYYKKLLEGEVVSYREIVNDHHIQDLLKTYGDRDVYDIYVERVVESTDTYDDKSNNYSSESESEESKSEDSVFEVGAWISDEDREEVELLRRKVREVKEKVKNGIPFPNHYNGDGYESQGFGSDENGYYVETDSDDETADHGVRMKNPYLMYNRNTDTPYFETTMTFTSLNEARTAVIKHSIKERRDVKYVKNESYRIRLKCKFENCSWLFFVSLNKRFNLWQMNEVRLLF
ncbi:hypothetical protein LINPERPRIM_LOCUS13225 [Linum perenne]